MEDIIVFGEDWGGHPSSTQHLIRHLRNERKVVWMNSIGLRSPRFSAHDLKRIFTKLGAMFLSSKEAEQGNMQVITPKALPFPGNKLARKWNKLSLQWSVRNASENAILFISLPTAIDAITSPDIKVIYYCCDDFGGLEGVDHEQVLALEAELAERADHIIITNPKLADKFDESKTHFISHGVDYDLFSQEYECPQDMPRGKKIAGFYGSIASWVNQDWLEYAAVEMPDWDFVMIGDVKTDVSTLESHDNIYFLGRKSHDELAAYVNNWDVSLIPFHDTRQIQHCNPLKLKEYMAAGKPIVSSGFPAVYDYDHLIYRVSSKEQFVACIKNADTEDYHLKIARQKMVENESWHAKAALVSEVISA